MTIQHSMIDITIKMLSFLEENGFNAYVVGGFVRDYLLNRESNDVDITTDATPKEIKEIFQDACLPNQDYGSVTVMYKNIHFEITTFRKEEVYFDNRRPSKVIYSHNLNEDLMRRDFTINAICMNKEKEILDPLGGQQDLINRKIRTIGKAKDRFSEDVLRILRAVRFATTLDFTLTTEVEEAIKETKYLLNHLSMERKKEELDKIFSSPNVILGLNLIKKLGLDKELGLERISQVKPCSQMMGIWTMLEVDELYPFTKNELDLMSNIRKVLKLSPKNKEALYYYGLYPSIVAGEILGIDRKEINEIYQDLPIHNRKDLAITTPQILSLLKKEPGPFLKDLYQYLEKAVLNKSLKNEKHELEKACLLFESKVH